MSAYIVDRGHIRFLIQAALTFSQRNGACFRFYQGETCHELRAENADAIGTMLWKENEASVSYRYPHDTNDLPGPVGDGPDHIYTHRACWLPINPLHVLSAVACYDYQSCEHPGWKESAAHAFCEALMHKAIYRLPGYDDAPWGAPKGWDAPAEPVNEVAVARKRRASR